MEDIWGTFQLKEILQNDPLTKTLVLLGTLNNKEAIVSLRKKKFNDISISDLILPAIIDGNLTETYANDIYRKFVLALPEEIDVSVIFPASSRDISKNRVSEKIIFHETPEIYEEKILPWILEMSFSKIQWILNILNGTSDQEEIIHLNSRFVFMPDFKWDGKDLDTLHCLAIVTDPSLYSLRDLNGSHIDLLEEIRDVGLGEIYRVYNLPDDKIKIFIHYHPSYYRLHIHFVNIETVNGGTDISKAHLLDDVIDNISIIDDYYEKKTFTYSLNVDSELYRIIHQ
jgi:m7GpppX diphosphatase